LKKYKYKIRFLPEADEDIKKLKKIGDKSLVEKLIVLLEELKEHPTTGTGKPEYLRYEKYWSRRINREHRLCYDIDGDSVVVLVLSAYGHYND
jgi:toxin YoeB